MTDPPESSGLDALFEEHYAALVRLAAVLLDDVGECEEIVQDAFAAMLRQTQGPVPGKEAAYLRSAVLNGARSRLRRRRVRRRHVALRPVPVEPAGDEAVERVETARVLVVLALPARRHR